VVVRIQKISSMSVWVLTVLFCLLGAGVSGSQGIERKPDVRDADIRPKPYPEPFLPPAGQSLVDPTFGTRILRLTDSSNAPHEAGVNSSAQDSMFNADASLFYLFLKDTNGNSIAHLFSLDRTTGRTAKLAPLSVSRGLAYDGARWDPSNPSLLYSIVMSSRQRQLWQMTFPYPGAATLLHDFSAEVPTGGYPYSRVQISPDSRYFGIAASTTGGQDTYDYVVVWDQKTDKAKILHTPSRLGTMLHSMVLDGTGAYALIETSDYARTYIWHWPSDTLSPALGIARPYFFGGHKVIGSGQVLSPGGTAGTWLVRSLATPATFSEALRYPRKLGKGNWFEDSHSSRFLGDRSFFQTRYVGTFGWGTLIRHAGPIYKLPGYLNLSPDFDAPEVVRYRGLSLRRVSGVPPAAGEWSYDSTADTLYLWLPDNSNPQANRAALSIFDWRPLMEEIIQVRIDDTSTNWRRLAHHRMHYNCSFATTPRGNADPTGSFVLFQSNWNGSPASTYSSSTLRPTIMRPRNSQSVSARE
jgi:hypothetical protein